MVLPDPVSPITTKIWLSLMALVNSFFNLKMGKDCIKSRVKWKEIKREVRVLNYNMFWKVEKNHIDIDYILEFG